MRTFSFSAKATSVLSVRRVPSRMILGTSFSDMPALRLLFQNPGISVREFSQGMPPDINGLEAGRTRTAYTGSRVAISGLRPCFHTCPSFSPDPEYVLDRDPALISQPLARSKCQKPCGFP